MKSNCVGQCKKISIQEQKRILLDMLIYVDAICRKNKIEYSLIGGSLIGAVRHGGFIPWDDDIDIILTKKNYERLKAILDDGRDRYQTLKMGEGGENFTFLKLIDKKTHLHESCQQKFNPEYGVFLDIFCYYPTSSDDKKRKKQYKKIQRIIRLIAPGRNEFHFKTLPHDFLRFCKNIILSNKTICRIIHGSFLKTINKYGDSKYVISNFPAYGLKKELQLKKDTDEYIDVKFEGVKVMIFKNYDNILKTTYGDYMKMPPKAERVSRHNMEMWWRN